MPTGVPEKPVVLVTGASGLIGTRVARDLSRDHQVVGLDIKPPHEGDGTMDFFEADLTSEGNIQDVLRQVRAKYGDRFASVIHLAAYYDFSGEPSPLYDELTVQGTRRLLQALPDCQAEQFIFSSTLLAMKPTEPGELLDESSPTQAEWEYPESKLRAEETIRQHRGAIPAVIARIAGVYDEHCRSLPISQQISRIYEKQLESHFFPGDMERGQAFIHLDDLVDFFRKTIERRHELPEYEVFLVAEPDVVSYGEMQDLIGEELHGKNWTTVRIPKVVAKAGAWVQDKAADEEHKPFIKPWMIDLADQHYAVDIRRARERLHWEPQRRLRTTLPRIIQHLKQDPEGWYSTNKLPKPDSLPKK